MFAVIFKIYDRRKHIVGYGNSSYKIFSLRLSGTVKTEKVVSADSYVSISGIFIVVPEICVRIAASLSSFYKCEINALPAERFPVNVPLIR